MPRSMSPSAAGMPFYSRWTDLPDELLLFLLALLPPLLPQLLLLLWHSRTSTMSITTSNCGDRGLIYIYVVTEDSYIYIVDEATLAPRSTERLCL